MAEGKTITIIQKGKKIEPLTSGGTMTFALSIPCTGQYPNSFKYVVNVEINGQVVEQLYVPERWGTAIEVDFDKEGKIPEYKDGAVLKFDFVEVWFGGEGFIVPEGGGLTDASRACGGLADYQITLSGGRPYKIRDCPQSNFGIVPTCRRCVK